MNIVPLGDRALILQAPRRQDALLMVIGWQWQLEAAALPGITEMLPCYCSLTLFYCPSTWDYASLAARISQIVDPALPSPSLEDLPCHVLPVCYDAEYAPDLETLCQARGLTPTKLVEHHTSPTYLVAGLGFSPGFGFLQGLPPALHHPRLATPRTRVPAGAVGIAHDQTGIYPSASAGGWNLIGRCPHPLTDLTASLPSLLQVGHRVQFRPISSTEFTDLQTHIRPHAPPTPDSASAGSARALRVGGLTTIQDLGRRQYRSQGFPHGGAMDAPAVKRINTFLGNHPAAPVLELSLIHI